MSLGYAEKLSYREDVGTVGMPELFDPPDAVARKIEELSIMIQKSKHLVAFTGAGISTSCGIPDFRGPEGIWTLQHAGKDLPDASLPFHRAMPSLTHMALVELERVGILKFLISQNVDSLHLRSGIPREKLAELHGNSFMEICPSCGVEYVRDFEVETIGLKETSRRCSDLTCGAKLRDSVLDWEDALPSKEMKNAQDHCKSADLVLSVGTSLQITPACNFPLLSIKNGGKLVIVNLQATPKDKKAILVIHALVDKVIAGVMHFLNFQIPPYIRVDFVRLILQHSFDKKGGLVRWRLRVASTHGEREPLPFIQSVEINFPDRSDLKPALLENQPFCMRRETLRSKALRMLVTLNFIDGCGCSCSKIEWPVDFEVPNSNTSLDKSEVLRALRESAEKDSCSGGSALLERRANSSSDESVHAVVTNIRRFTTEAYPRDPGLASWIRRCRRRSKRRPCGIFSSVICHKIMKC